MSENVFLTFCQFFSSFLRENNCTFSFPSQPEAEALYLPAFNFFPLIFLNIFVRYKILVWLFLSSSGLHNFWWKVSLVFNHCFTIYNVFVFPLAAFINLCLVFRILTVIYLSVLLFVFILLGIPWVPVSMSCSFYWNLKNYQLQFLHIHFCPIFLFPVFLGFTYIRWINPVLQVTKALIVFFPIFFSSMLQFTSFPFIYLQVY